MYNNSGSMKWYPRLKIYKTKSGHNEFNPETMVAVSYKWWTYVKKFGSTTVFNDYNYSVTTSGHQSETKGLLRELLGEEKYSKIIFVNQPGSLSSGISLEHLYEEIALLKVKMGRKGAGKAKKAEYIAEIADIRAKIAQLRRLNPSARFSMSQQKNQAKRVLERENARLERNREQARAYRAKRAQLLQEHGHKMVDTGEVEI